MSVRLSLSRLLRANLSALTLRPAEPLEFSENLILIGFHGVGLTTLVLYFHLPGISIVLLLTALVILQLTTRTAILAPLFFVYAVLLMWFVFVRIMHGTVGGYYDYLQPEWGLPLLDVQVATVAGGINVMLSALASILKPRRRAVFLTALAMLALTLAWGSVEYFGHRTQGTTGSDPYAYVQMGIDLATRATAVHRFDLFPEIAPMKIAWYPVIHVGYHLPMNEQGDAVSVFPIGGAFAYAMSFRIFGEEGLYWVNPFFSLLSALGAWLLAWELTRNYSPVLRAMTSAITSALVATANQQVVWAGVTMVDAQAEFFSILSIFFALRSKNDKSIWPLLLSGATLGAAYWVRHTQIVLAFSLLVLFWMCNDTFGGRARAVIVSAAAALALGIGDLWYHQAYLGGWLHPESEELALFSANVIAESAGNLFQQAFAANEFGWLAPFLIYGAVQFGRRSKAQSAALIVWLALSLALHLPYAAVRSRDLLPEFPAIAFLTAFGLCFLAEKLLSSRRMQWVAGVLIFAVLELLLLRVWNTVPRAWQPAQPNFGYMTESQRAAFDQLAALTPEDAIIGSTLNDGAIELYSKRNTFRPDAWKSADLREFLSIARQSHSSAYLVEDGAAMDSVLDDLRRDLRVRRVGTLDVPLFGGAPIAEPGALWKIEE